MWFQQDGATYHLARETMQLLHEKFSDRVILRNGDVNWSPKSCDLTRLDYSLWSCLKERVYTDNPETTERLKEIFDEKLTKFNLLCCKKLLKTLLNE